MPTHQQRRRSINEGAETDEDIPALQSPSDSSESEDEAAPHPRPTARQRTVPLRRPVAPVFDSDDSDIDITESGTVPLSFDSRDWLLIPHTLIPPLLPQTYGSRGDCSGNSKNTRTLLYLPLLKLRAMALASSLRVCWRPYSSPAPVRTRAIEAIVGIEAGIGAGPKGRTQCRRSKRGTRSYSSSSPSSATECGTTTRNENRIT